MWQYNHTSNLMHSAYAENPYYAVEYSDDLYHYGILGMKWGIRKERPTTGGRRGSGKKLTAKQKRIIRNVAIGAGATAAVAGGALLVKKGIRAHKLNKAYQNGLINGFGSYRELGKPLPAVVNRGAAVGPRLRTLANTGRKYKVLRNIAIGPRLRTLANPGRKSKVLRNIAIGAGATAATAGLGYGGYKGYQAYQKKKKR